MKVLQINSVCGIRSTGRICTDIAAVLESQGHECKIAYGRESVPEQHKNLAVRIGSSLSVKIDALLTRIFDNAGFNSVCATKKFIKWVNKYDPDVIHLHNIHGYYINIKRLFDYLKKSGKLIANTQKINPMPVITGAQEYPQDIIHKLNGKIQLVAVDALSLAQEAGNIKAVNVVLIGLLANSMDVEKQVWIEVLKETVPPKFLEVNLKAFELGYNTEL